MSAATATLLRQTLELDRKRLALEPLLVLYSKVNNVISPTTEWDCIDALILLEIHNKHRCEESTAESRMLSVDGGARIEYSRRDISMWASERRCWFWSGRIKLVKHAFA